MWYPTGGTEAGIDGTLEIVNSSTDEATNQIITVQSKATTDFRSETEDYVEFTCKDRDIDYWLSGNTPIILVYSKPRNNEAYWVSVKDYFSDTGEQLGGLVCAGIGSGEITADGEDDTQEMEVPAGRAGRSNGDGP